MTGAWLSLSSRQLYYPILLVLLAAVACRSRMRGRRVIRYTRVGMYFCRPEGIVSSAVHIPDSSRTSVVKQDACRLRRVVHSMVLFVISRKQNGDSVLEISEL
ncbi:hypothetical protein BO82DRAFT_65686 [Aspergillus uvarum CBS 121591]|uniref:Uncharacterized protein n=1 Tax=Aspergillus uvarum CBS 121591 TaxID=1448315 RepID=A0A319C943_9EURO|nr:hypothetical protein BO82DRAFT_65686 [Aspergillus uvarum CBS 121591]PYH82326.1 hypothetical protein BO82DRAFT_65686 [Aspergillus uvarum CBS 121591]